MVGNSHLAAIRLAWKEYAESYPRYRVKFYGSTRNSLRGIVSQKDFWGTYLGPKEAELRKRIQRVTGGSAKLRPKHYDGIILFSLGFNFQAAERIYTDFRLPGFRQNPASSLITEACFRAALKGALLDSAASYIARQIRSISNVPIYLSAQPYPSETIVSDGKRAVWQELVEADLNDLLRLYQGVAEEVARDLGITLFMPPPEVEVSPGLSAHSYCEGALRLDLKTPKGNLKLNYSHMNAHYGKAVLDQILGQGFI
jgi:hypothetical protein